MQEKKLTVLIADDEPLVRSLLLDYLMGECHYKVIVARDGRQALTLFQRHVGQINITFLDIEMPKLDGLRVLRGIRVVDRKAYVVILSGAGNLENVKAAMAAGMNGFIVKPFSNKKIAEALDNYFDQRGSGLKVSKL